jgi:hypothetical protein
MWPNYDASTEGRQLVSHSSHQFAQRQTAIRWLEWLHRKQANTPIEVTSELAALNTCEEGFSRVDIVCEFMFMFGLIHELSKGIFLSSYNGFQ